MTDELDPQTQQHIDHSEDAVDDCDTPTCVDASTDAPATADAHAGADKATDTDDTVEHDESEQPEPSDAEPDTDPAPQAAGPIEVSSEEELDAVMDSMMDAVKAMKDAVADADIDAEEEEAAEAASTFVPGETPVADQGSTMPSFLQLEHPTIGADAVDPHAAGFSVVEGGTGNIAAPQAADADAVDTARPIAPHSPDANRDLGTAVSNTANAVGTFIAQGASAMREMNAAKKALADARAHLAELEQRIVDQAEELETLRHEYAELQRNPSANPANYTVRTSELSMQISDTADALRKAEEDVPCITADLEHSLAAAEQAVEQAQAPIADAKRAHQAVTTEADAARDELQTAKTAATTRQRELREKIAAEDKARRDQEQSIANAQADAAHAQSIIEQATEVHDHPEITESLAGSLARDKAEHAETEREVAQLEATEDAVRERTRDSRIKFTGAIVCIVAAILVIILVWLFASK